jgi:hypothetical protein
MQVVRPWRHRREPCGAAARAAAVAAPDRRPGDGARAPGGVRTARPLIATMSTAPKYLAALTAESTKSGRSSAEHSADMVPLNEGHIAPSRRRSLACPVC